MKWFKHSIHARSEHGTEDILRCYGPAGIGVYWCLLEMLARDAERFRLRIAGVSAEADERFEQARRGPGREPPADHLYRIDLLARTLNTDAELVLAVVSLGVSEGLFDQELWEGYSVLYSPAFCTQADEYTRRLLRSRQQPGSPDPSAETLRTTPESLRTTAVQVTEEERREEESGREEREKQQPPSRGGQHCTESPDDADRLLLRLTMLVADWNRKNRRAFELKLTRTALLRLMGGDPVWRQRVCYESMNLTHGGTTFPDVLLRAVWLMLEASRQKPIGDQFAWLWSCVHGTRDSPPWVHRPTAAEERHPRGRPAAGEQGFRTIGELLALQSSVDGGTSR